MNCHCARFEIPVVVGSGANAVCIVCKRKQKFYIRTVKCIEIRGRENFVSLGDFVVQRADGSYATANKPGVVVARVIAATVQGKDNNMQTVDALFSKEDESPKFDADGNPADYYFHPVEIRTVDD